MHPVDGTFPTILAPGPSQFEIHPTVRIRDFVAGEGITEASVSAALLRFRVSASLDNATMTASLTFTTQYPGSVALGQPAGSLSPLVTTSPYYNLLPNGPVLRPNNEIELTVQIFPGGGGYRLFMGRIDRVAIEANGEQITVTCRDMGGYLLNSVIETATHQGSAGGEPAEGVMNTLLTTNGWTGLSVLSGSPGFSVLDYAQEEMPVLDALRRIAQQFGWDVRWFPTEGSGVKVRLYDPARTRTLPDLTIGAGRYSSIEELAWGDEDVRNVWDVWWQDETGAPQGPVSVEDAVSIAKYGRRYARIYLQRAENIRSVATATAFAEAALTDNKDPFASHVIRAPLLPMIELNDIHKYVANGIHYDEDQQFAVVSYSHDFAKGHGTTTVGVRGRPIAAYREYRRSVPPKTIVSTLAPTTEYAPEGTIWVQTDSLAFAV